MHANWTKTIGSLRRRALVGAVVAAAAGGVAYAAAATGGNGPPLPAGKLAHQTVIDAGRAGLPHDPAGKSAALKAPPVLPAQAGPGQPETGILATSEAPFPKGVYAIENSWQSLHGGVLTQAYAGASATDPQQGVVVLHLIAWPADQDLGTRTFATPTKAGALRIVAAQGVRLTLATQSGARFTFDVATHTLSGP